MNLMRVMIKINIKKECLNLNKNIEPHNVKSLNTPNSDNAGGLPVFDEKDGPMGSFIFYRVIGKDPGIPLLEKYRLHDHRQKFHYPDRNSGTGSAGWLCSPNGRAMLTDVLPGYRH